MVVNIPSSGSYYSGPISLLLSDSSSPRIPPSSLQSLTRRNAFRDIVRMFKAINYDWRLHRQRTTRSVVCHIFADPTDLSICRYCQLFHEEV